METKHYEIEFKIGEGNWTKYLAFELNGERSPSKEDCKREIALFHKDVKTRIILVVTTRTEVE